MLRWEDEDADLINLTDKKSQYCCSVLKERYERLASNHFVLFLSAISWSILTGGISFFFTILVQFPQLLLLAFQIDNEIVAGSKFPVIMNL